MVRCQGTLAHDKLVPASVSVLRAPHVRLACFVANSPGLLPRYLWPHSQHLLPSSWTKASTCARCQDEPERAPFIPGSHSKGDRAHLEARVQHLSCTMTLLVPGLLLLSWVPSSIKTLKLYFTSA